MVNTSVSVDPSGPATRWVRTPKDPKNDSGAGLDCANLVRLDTVSFGAARQGRRSDWPLGSLTEHTLNQRWSMLRYRVYQGGHSVQLSNELFFALFSIVMVVAVIWFVRSASRFKAWAKNRDEKNMDG